MDVAETITQTADGYLWLGTTMGLLRFDGVKFVRYAPAGLNLPADNFTYLLGARDGSLWIGTSSGLGRLKDGRYQTYIKPAEDSGISAILEDDQGTIWVTRYRILPSQGPLCRIEGNGLHCFGKADGIPVRYGLGLTKDKSGNIWFGSSVLCRWRPGSADTYLNYLQKSLGNSDVVDVAAGKSGEIWAAIGQVGPGMGLRHFSSGKWADYVIPGLDGPRVLSSALFVDRNQSLWVGTNKGVYRVHDGIADHYGISDGLSGDSVGDIYEDHEGNIWLSTNGGLDMFRDTAVVSYSSRQGLSPLSYSILALWDDSIWIGEDNVVDILKGGHHSVLASKDLAGYSVTALFQDHLGTVWVGAGGNLLTYQHDRLEKVLTIKMGQGNFFAVEEDTNHNIWALTDYGLFSLKNRIARKVLSTGSNSRWRGTLPDPAGGIWIAAHNGELTHYAEGTLRTIPLNLHDSSFEVLGIIADSDNSVLEFTTNGLFRWDNHGWKVLNSRNGLPCDLIYSAIKASDGALWLFSRCGLVKIERSEVEKWHQESDSKLAIEIFDKFDGMRVPGLPIRAQPVASETSDGRLWFIEPDSAQTIDPKQVYKNSILPPVYIEKIIADRKDYAVENGLHLPPLSRDVEIDYTALSFAVPQKVRFRYRLEGRDTSWQEPETRRQAFYTDLRPGKYRFHVIACNNSGVWNEEGASLDFNIAPAWYQANWFRIACAAAFLVALWFIYQLRLRQLHHQFSIGLEARVNERTRIARDLHDTLLQSFHGLLLRFQTVYALLPSRPEEAKQSLGSVIDQAAQAITESRDAVQGLRSSTIESNDLAAAIRAFGEELSADETNRNSAVFQVQVEGTPRNLNPILRDDVYRIACEALRNAFRHAQARQIEVEIRYDEGHIRLRVRDDGKGIDPKFLRGDGREGHYGLHGMRERSELVGGKLTVWSNLNSGTEVELSIPAVAAYATSSRRSWLFEKFSGRETPTKRDL